MLPVYAATFGAGPTQIGVLVALFAVMRIVGPVVVGIIAERVGVPVAFGRGPGLVLVFVTS